MINFNWQIDAKVYAPIEGDLRKVIKIIHWIYVGTTEYEGKTVTQDVYGAEEVGTPNPENFIPYEEIPNETIYKWLEKKLPLQEYQKIITENINDIINPKLVTDYGPFTTTTTSTIIVE